MTSPSGIASIYGARDTLNGTMSLFYQDAGVGKRKKKRVQHKTTDQSPSSATVHSSNLQGVKIEDKKKSIKSLKKVLKYTIVISLIGDHSSMYNSA